MILLPLKSDLGDISRALGCLVAKGDMGSAPRRFEITSMTCTPLVPSNGPVTLPAPLSATKETAEPSGFAEPSRAFDPTGGKKRPPYLRLIKTDE